MRGYTKIVILVVIFGILLIAVLAIQKKQAGQTRQARVAQTAAMFPDLVADGIYRFEVTSLQNESLLFRKQAGIWEVSTGLDVMRQIMQQQPSEPEPIEPPVEEIETVTEDQEVPVEDETDEVPADETEPEPAEPPAEESTPPADPRDDPGPSGDMFRTFYKADPEKVQAMIDAIVGLPQGQLVTSDPDQKSSLGVLNSIVGIEVTLYDGQMNELAAMIIGNQGAGFLTTYVRKPDQDEIYQVPESLSMLFGTSLIALRDRNVFTASPETITSVNIRNFRDETTIRLSRQEGAWVGYDAGENELELDPANVDTLLSGLGSLSSNAFVDPNIPPAPRGEVENWDENDPWGLLNPTAVVEFTTADNVTHSLTVGRQEGTTYYAAITNRLNDAFKVSGTRIDGILPDAEALASGGAAPTASEGAASLQGGQAGLEILEPGSLTPVPSEGSGGD